MDSEVLVLVCMHVKYEYFLKRAEHVWQALTLQPTTTKPLGMPDKITE